MKKFALLILACVAVALPCRGAEQKCDSQRVLPHETQQNITLYTQMAAIEHVYPYTGRPGVEREFVFENLPADIAQARLRVQADGEVVWVRSQTVMCATPYEPRQSLEARRDALALQQQTLADEIAILEYEQRILIVCQNMIPRTISEQAVQKVDTPRYQTWQNALSFVDLHTDSNVRMQRKARLELALITDQLTAVNNTLTRYPMPLRSMRTNVTVRVRDGKAAEKAFIRLSYLTTAARFTPSYTLSEGTTPENARLQYRAEVVQNTGYDWSGAQIRFSSAAPTLSPAAPVWPALWQSTAESQGHALEPFRPGKAAAVCAQNLPERLKQNSVESRLETVVSVPEKLTLRGGETRFSTVLFDALVPFEQRDVCLLEGKGGVQRYYFVGNTLPFAGLPGVLRAQRADGIVGSAQWPLTLPNAIGKVTCGECAGIHVQRLQPIRYLEKTGLFTKHDAEVSSYGIVFRNDRAETVQFTLSAVVPCAQTEQGEIAIVRRAGKLHNGTHTGYDYDADSGSVTWQVTLAPGETQTYALTYRKVLKK